MLLKIIPGLAALLIVAAASIQQFRTTEARGPSAGESAEDRWTDFRGSPDRLVVIPEGASPEAEDLRSALRHLFDSIGGPPTLEVRPADEVTRAVTFLAAQNAGYITGSNISVNGGQHMF